MQGHTNLHKGDLNMIEKAKAKGASKKQKFEIPTKVIVKVWKSDDGYRYRQVYTGTRYIQYIGYLVSIFTRAFFHFIRPLLSQVGSFI